MITCHFCGASYKGETSQTRCRICEKTRAEQIQACRDFIARHAPNGCTECGSPHLQYGATICDSCIDANRIEMEFSEL